MIGYVYIAGSLFFTVYGQIISKWRLTKLTFELPVGFMKVLTSHKAADINDVAMKSIEKESLIITDKSTSYEYFSRIFDTHISFNSDKTTTKISLKWVHVTISNEKRNLLGVYHMI
jgi:hypothetical protein